MIKTNRHLSRFIRPITLILDLIIVNSFAFFFFPDVEYKLGFPFLLSLFWIILSWTTNFYEVFRHTKVVKICSKLFRQFVGFSIVIAAFNGIASRFSEPLVLLEYTFFSFIVVSALKFGILFLLKYFRRVFGGNYRNVIIVGDSKEAKALGDLFEERKDMGYRLIHIFEGETSGEEIEDFILNNEINEIFISYSLILENVYPSLLDFSDSNLVSLKYVVSDKQLLIHNLEVEYYDYIPIVPRRVIPLDKPQNRLIKRLFDLVFSTCVIIFVLSWLIPVIAILIKLESKGPVFFKQIRTGLNDRDFACYKFRSMRVNIDSDQKQATKNDCRITKTGAFIRKTSLDEFPQFFNVFVGDMSIVGPRPHMVVHTKMYSKRVNRFMLRHLVKPGITGMAQTHGYRGEIENDRDIINRFKYDLFYLENWSIFLDLKIIYLTVKNVFTGEEKAY